MQVLTGTSGFSYPAWKGSFYPPKLPAKQMLAYYAQRLRTVEINNTFYRMPRPEPLAAWAQEAPSPFSFALKAPKRITHELRLKPEAKEPLARFLETIRVLGSQRGPTLFQLPPNMKPDLPRLNAFLDDLRALDAHMPLAFEFRQAAWFTDETYEILSRHHAALCLADAEDLSTPVVKTAPYGYLRLRRQDYDERHLETWAAHIRKLAWPIAHVFFKHEDEGRGPALAERMSALLAGGPGAAGTGTV